MPSKSITLLYIFLVVINTLGFLDQSSALPLKFDIFLKYLVYQSGLLFGSALSPPHSYSRPASFIIEKLL